MVEARAPWQPLLAEVHEAIHSSSLSSNCTEYEKYRHDNATLSQVQFAEELWV